MAEIKSESVADFIPELVADFARKQHSAINQRLDASLAQFAGRPLAEAFPYLILDARYERVRESGVITGQAVLIAIGIDWDGRRQVLAVELADRESRLSWRDFCGPQGARSAWDRICRRRRSRRPAGGVARGSSGGRFASPMVAVPLGWVGDRSPPLLVAAEYGRHVGVGDQQLSRHSVYNLPISPSRFKLRAFAGRKIAPSL